MPLALWIPCNGKFLPAFGRRRTRLQDWTGWTIQRLLPSPKVDTRLVHSAALAYAGPLAGLVRDLVTETHSLGRVLFPEEALETMVTTSAEGAGQHFKTLGYLVSVELWRRQLSETRRDDSTSG